MTGWERAMSYVAVALCAGSLVALVVKHQGPLLWADEPVSASCRDSFFMTCQISDDSRSCAPGARGALEQFEMHTPLPHGCIAWICRCAAPASSAPEPQMDAGLPDVSADAGVGADGA